jgi:hypothetical protein
MGFRKAVNATQELSGAYFSGIRALAEVDRNRIECLQTRRLRGSVNLETTLRDYYPNEPIWDYGVGWRVDTKNDCAVWIEVHPASSGHVDSVINKVKWLKIWLQTSAPALSSLTRGNDGYVWIASGRVLFQRTSRQARQLAAAGVSFPRERFMLA